MQRNLCMNSIHLSPIKDTREIDPNCTHLGSYSAAGPSDKRSSFILILFQVQQLYTIYNTHTIKHVQSSLLQLLIPEAAVNPGMKTYDEYIQHMLQQIAWSYYTDRKKNSQRCAYTSCMIVRSQLASKPPGHQPAQQHHMTAQRP